MHGLQLSNQEPAFIAYYLLVQPEGREKDLLKAIPFQPGDFLRTGVRFLPAFEQICAKAKNPNPALDSSACYQLVSVLYELSYSHPERKSSISDSYTDQLLGLMRKKLYSHVDWKQAAQSFHISKAHLIRLFKVRMGMPPAKYFVSMKMDMARHLLETTNCTISEIAENLQYYDEFHFSKAFKTWNGISPSAYRTKKTKETQTGSGRMAVFTKGLK